MDGPFLPESKRHSEKLDGACSGCIEDRQIDEKLAEKNRIPKRTLKNDNQQRVFFRGDYLHSKHTFCLGYLRARAVSMFSQLKQ